MFKYPRYRCGGFNWHCTLFSFFLNYFYLKLTPTQPFSREAWFDQLESTSLEDIPTQILAFLAKWFLRSIWKKTNTFWITPNYLPLEKNDKTFILTNWNFLHPILLCTKFGWNWFNGSGEEVENKKRLRTDGLKLSA